MRAAAGRRGVRARRVQPGAAVARSRSRPESHLRVRPGRRRAADAGGQRRHLHDEDGEWLAEPDLHYEVREVALEYNEGRADRPTAVACAATSRGAHRHERKHGVHPRRTCRLSVRSAGGRRHRATTDRAAPLGPQWPGDTGCDARSAASREWRSCSAQSGRECRSASRRADDATGGDGERVEVVGELEPLLLGGLAVGDHVAQLGVELGDLVEVGGVRRPASRAAPPRASPARDLPLEPGQLLAGGARIALGGALRQSRRRGADARRARYSSTPPGSAASDPSPSSATVESQTRSMQVAVVADDDQRARPTSRADPPARPGCRCRGRWSARRAAARSAGRAAAAAAAAAAARRRTGRPPASTACRCRSRTARPAARPTARRRRARRSSRTSCTASSTRSDDGSSVTSCDR